MTVLRIHRTRDPGSRCLGESNSFGGEIQSLPESDPLASRFSASGLAVPLLGAPMPGGARELPLLRAARGQEIVADLLHLRRIQDNKQKTNYKRQTQHIKLSGGVCIMCVKCLSCIVIIRVVALQMTTTISHDVSAKKAQAWLQHSSQNVSLSCKRTACQGLHCCTAVQLGC